MEKEIYTIIRDYLVNKLDPSYIVIFGSFAKNTQHKESDIDLAFYHPNSPFSAYDLFMAAQELADILKIEVDLVDLKSASTVFQAQIYSSGIVIFAKDEILFKNQQMTALSMYASLNEERAAILNKVKESGTIYEK